MNCYSHTIVRNGMPFIPQVLRQVAPFASKMLVTLSENSIDGTREALIALKSELGEKMNMDMENVENPADLTTIRQRQLDQTPDGEWVLFLDDDDWYSRDALQQIEMFLGNDIDGIAVRPYQLTGGYYYDPTWDNKWFTKLFRKQKGVHYRHPWPRDLIYKNDDLLYWKKNARVPRVPTRFFHLSYLKDHSFRTEKWALDYRFNKGKEILLPEVEWENARRILTGNQ